jgi:hypothetical protein
MSVIFLRIMTCEPNNIAFINIYGYSNFESHKSKVAEHFRLLKEEIICLLAINKQIIVEGDFNSPLDTYNGTWSKNRTNF